MALTDNLISHWAMDEAGGNALDSHGSNTLTETLGTIGTAAGKVGNARNFESGDTEYFSIADNDDLSVGDIDWTISTWVLPESIPTYATIACKGWPGVQDSNSEFILFYNTDAGRFQLSVRGPSSGSQVLATSFGAATSGNWYHVVAWHDSINNVIGVSVNTVANTASWSGGINNGNQPFVIGSDPPLSLFWDGLIDEVSVWKRVLTSDERTALYNGGAGIAYPFTPAQSPIPIFMHYYRQQRSA